MGSLDRGREVLREEMMKGIKDFASELKQSLGSGVDSQDGGEITLPIKGDAKSFREEVEEGVEYAEKQSPTIPIKGDAKSFREEVVDQLKDVANEVKQINNNTSSLFSGNDLTKFSQSLQDIVSELKNVNAALGAVDDDEGVTNLLSQLNNVSLKLDEIHSQTQQGLLGDGWSKTASSYMKQYDKFFAQMKDFQSYSPENILGAVGSKVDSANIEAFMENFSRQTLIKLNPQEQVKRIVEFFNYVKKLRLSSEEISKLGNADKEFNFGYQLSQSMSNVRVNSDFREVENNINKTARRAQEIQNATISNANINGIEKEAASVKDLDGNLTKVIQSLDAISMALFEMGSKDNLSEFLNKAVSLIDELTQKTEQLALTMRGTLATAAVEATEEIGKEASGMNDVATNGEKAAEAKKDFANANEQGVIPSAKEGAEALEKEATEAKNLEQMIEERKHTIANLWTKLKGSDENFDTEELKNRILDLFKQLENIEDGASLKKWDSNLRIFKTDYSTYTEEAKPINKKNDDIYSQQENAYKTFLALENKLIKARHDGDADLVRTLEEQKQAQYAIVEATQKEIDNLRETAGLEEHIAKMNKMRTDAMRRNAETTAKYNDKDATQQAKDIADALEKESSQNLNNLFKKQTDAYKQFLALSDLQKEAEKQGDSAKAADYEKRAQAAYETVKAVQQELNALDEVVGREKQIAELRKLTNENRKKNDDIYSQQEKESLKEFSKVLSQYIAKRKELLKLGDSGENNKELRDEVASLEAKLESLRETAKGSFGEGSNVVNKMTDSLKEANQEVTNFDKHLRDIDYSKLYKEFQSNFEKLDVFADTKRYMGQTPIDAAALRGQFEETIAKLPNMEIPQATKAMQELNEAFKKVVANAREYGDAIAKPQNVSNMMSKIRKWLQQNSAASDEAKQSLKDYYNELERGTVSVGYLAKIADHFNRIDAAEREAGRTGKSFFDTLRGRAEQMTTNFIAMYFSMYDVFRYMREGIEIVHELDDSLTEMRKVSDESLTSLKEYQKSTFDTAGEIGTTAKQLQDSTADFMRLGESLDEASKSAQSANILMNVSEFGDISEATDSLIAMSAAYDDLEKLDIVDKLNEIGK